MILETDNLITSGSAAEICNVSKQQFRLWYLAGLTPEAVKIDGFNFFDKGEIEGWTPPVIGKQGKRRTAG